MTLKYQNKEAYQLAFLQEESYAADKQDIYLRDFLFGGKKNGYFVDCGSADGLYKSNTFLLERDLGWNGICIEGRGNGYLSYELCNTNRTVKCFNEVLGSYDGQKLPWNDTELTGSSATETLMNLICKNTCNCPFCSKKFEVSIDLNSLLNKLKEGGYDFNVVHPNKVKARSLLSILKEANAPKEIDLLSMDIEGAEEPSLMNFPFDKYDIKVLCVETPSQLLISHLSNLGYNRYRTINNWPDNSGTAFSDNNDHLYVKREL